VVTPRAGAGTTTLQVQGQGQGQVRGRGAEGGGQESQCHARSRCDKNKDELAVKRSVRIGRRHAAEHRRRDTDGPLTTDEVWQPLCGEPR